MFLMSKRFSCQKSLGIPALRHNCYVNCVIIHHDIICYAAINGKKKKKKTSLNKIILSFLEWETAHSNTTFGGKIWPEHVLIHIGYTW